MTLHGVARNTAREAIRLLTDEGLETAEHGRGVFVREKRRLLRFGSERYAGGEACRRRAALRPALRPWPRTRRALMAAATDYATQDGLRLVLDVMTKDAAAIKLYERLGWRRIGTTRHDNGKGRSIPAYCYVSPAPHAVCPGVPSPDGR